MNRTSGFTLVELLITIAIAAIVLTLAVPSFRDVIENNRVVTHANAMVGTFALARSEAIKRGAPVSVCRAGTDWGAGWQIRSGDDCAAGEELREGLALPPGVTLTQPGTAVIQFAANGLLDVPGAEVSFAFAPGNCTAGAERRRVLTVGVTGRAAVTRAACL